MIETINGKAYLKVGDKVYELGGGSNIITADSVEQLPDPASVPERTIALVKSEGGGGLPVVELTTTLTYDGTTLTDTENAAISSAFATGEPFVMKFDFDAGAQTFNGITCVPITFTANGMKMVLIGIMTMMIQFVCGVGDTTWSLVVQQNG